MAFITRHGYVTDVISPDIPSVCCCLITPSFARIYPGSIIIKVFVKAVMISKVPMGILYLIDFTISIDVILLEL